MAVELPPTMIDNELGEIVIPHDGMTEKDKREAKASVQRRIDYIEGLYDD